MQIGSGSARLHSFIHSTLHVSRFHHTVSQKTETAAGSRLHLTHTPIQNIIHTPSSLGVQHTAVESNNTGSGGAPEVGRYVHREGGQHSSEHPTAGSTQIALDDARTAQR